MMTGNKTAATIKIFTFRWRERLEVGETEQPGAMKESLLVILESELTIFDLGRNVFGGRTRTFFFFLST